MRNVIIVILWALLLAAGIFAYSFYRHGTQVDQALETSKSELATLQNQTSDLSRKLAAATDTISRLEATAQQQVADLQSSREAADQSATRFQSLQDEVGKLKAALAAKNQELAALGEQYSKKTATSVETLSQKSRLFADLQTAHKDLAAKVDAASATIKQLQLSEKGLQGQLAAEKKAGRQARLALEGLNMSEAYLQTQLAEALDSQNRIGAEHQQTAQKLAAAQRQISGLEGQLADKTAELARLEGEKDSVLNQTERIKATYEALVSGLKEDIDKKRAAIEAFEDKVRVRFVDRVLFKSGHATVTAEGRVSLQKVAAALAAMPGYTIRVSGHTDNVPISQSFRSKYPTNWELSGARAAAVARYFVEELGWDGSRLQAIGHADFQPVGDNETEAGRGQNRRVEIAVIPADSP